MAIVAALMMKSTQTTGWWMTELGWRKFRCQHGAVVEKLEPCDLFVSELDDMQSIASTDHPCFIPAPIDLHVHGGGGADVMQGDEALIQVLRTHAKHGTGALLATSVTAPFDQITEFLHSVKRVMHTQPEDSAVLLGAHLEGPFINPDKLGAQPPFATVADLTQLQHWLETGVVKVITYAPEMDPGNAIPALCANHGVKCQIGHSLCQWQQASNAIKQGCGITHLFNAMSSVTHRSGGVAAAALAYADYAEVITDGIHVDQAAFDLARRGIPCLYSVTDATAAAGMPDGDYQLGSITVTKKGSEVLLPDGTLAGSCLTQLRSLAVLRQWGLSWRSISDMCSRFPARWLQLDDDGAIAEGAAANWLELYEYQPIALWLAGRRYALQGSP